MPASAPLAVTLFPTDLGWMGLAARGERLVRGTFGHPSGAAALAHLSLEDAAVVERGDLSVWFAQLADRLAGYATGEVVSFDDVPLDLSHLTPFGQRVVRACRKIGRGKTRTYGDLAAAVGSPGASRAVGSVMAKNRLPIVIPCHRVVGSAGSLGGFSAPEGLSMKRRMLALEGTVVGVNRPSARSPLVPFAAW
ncbi:MAG: methylated-DNA--[protein]-cysteine S-methyltransferase [Pirellulaceae bacterium]